MADGGFREVLTAAQVADLLQLNLDYVGKLIREGVIPAARLPGERVSATSAPTSSPESAT